MFYSTEDAIAHGLTAGTQEKRRLMGLRAEFERKCSAALGRGSFDVASHMATQAQFCREAVDADKLVKYLSAGIGGKQS